ncbi:hypothetical protein [Deinococcus sp. UYEF24]
MASAFDPDGLDADLALDVFAAQLRLSHQGALEQAERIATRLTELLPHLSTRTDQRRWPLGRPSLSGLRVRLGSEHFDLQVEHGQVRYRTVHHVSGVDLGHQELSQDEWLTRLMSALTAQAGQGGGAHSLF